jgi:putative ABC transport system permease protein
VPVSLLPWDFSKPVLLANLIAWPLAYPTMRSYLDGFAERTALSPLIFIGAGLAALLVAWIVVAAHEARNQPFGKSDVRFHVNRTGYILRRSV